MRHFLVGLVVLAACADQGALTPQEKAEAYFDDSVYPVLVQQCASCHTTAGVVFMGTDAGSTYTNLSNSTVVDNFSTTAPFFTALGTDHQPVISSADANVFVEWFQLERDARDQ